MKKLFLSIISVFMITCSFSTVFADDYDYFNSSYGTWSYYHISQVNNSTSADFNEVGLSIGGLSFPIPNYTGAVSLVYQFNKSYSGTLTFNYDSSVSSAYKLIYGDYGAKINYSSGSSVNVSITDCTRLELIVLGSNATKVNSIDYSLTATSGNSPIDYSGQLSNIYQVLGYINTTTSNIYSHIDNLEGYVDNLESYVDGVESSLTSINTNLSNINSSINASNVNTSNISINVSNIYSLLNDLYDYYGNKLTSIINNTDSLESLLTTINNSINNIQNMQLQVADIQLPYYQYLFFSMLTHSDMSLIKFDESNIPFVQWGDIKNLDLKITFNGNLTLVYYVNNSQYNHILLDGADGIDIRYGISTNTRYGVLSRYNTNGTKTISFINTNNQVVPPDSTRIYPLYMGYDHIPEEIALLFPGVESSSSINKNVQTVQNLLTNILNYLINLDISSDNAVLISAIDTLTLAISQMNQDITVTNNVNVNAHDIPFYQYVLLTMLCRTDLSAIKWDKGMQPFVEWQGVKNYNMTFNAGTGNNDFIIAFYSTDANMTITVDNQSVTRYRGVGNSNKFLNFYIGNYAFGNHTVQFVTTSNNGVISDTARIYPLYMGRLDSIPEDIGAVLGIVNNGNRYVNVLNNILSAINDLNMSTSYNVSNEQVYDITVDFDSNMDIVNNVEVDFNSSFESSNNSITSSDLTINLQPYSESISLYHNLFSSIYNIPLFKYVVIICMVGGVVLVLLG